MSLFQKSVLTVDQFNPDIILELFNTADFLEKFDSVELRKSNSEILKGYVSANLFYEPSTRTSSSFYSAMTKLGGSVIPINEVNYSSVIKGESLEDTVRTLECYADIIILRHSNIGSAKKAAEVLNIPVINAGDGAGEHPTQALLDLYTILKEKGWITGLKIGLMGDLKYGRTVHSLSKLLRNYEVQLFLISPENLKMPDELCDSNDIHTNDIRQVIEKLDVLYMTRVQRERIFNTDEGVHPALKERNDREIEKIIDQYSINREIIEKNKRNVTIMHPLPRVREIPIELDSYRGSAYFRQMKNGLYVRMALLKMILKR